jgi:nucleoside 2-deoxyribosyltransferase
MRSVYLAGPEVFLANAREIGARKKALCAAHGLNGLYPLDNAMDGAGRSRLDMAQAIYAGNVALMDRADLIIANLTPFRGPSMDPGTAFEIGYCAARGLPLFGYSNVAGTIADRVPVAARRGAVLLDRDGLEIEDFGLSENLMIEVPMRASGALETGAASPDALYTDLTLFEAVLKRAAHERV